MTGKRHNLARGRSVSGRDKRREGTGEGREKSEEAPAAHRRKRQMKAREKGEIALPSAGELSGGALREFNFESRKLTFEG